MRFTEGALRVPETCKSDSQVPLSVLQKATKPHWALNRGERRDWRGQCRSCPHPSTGERAGTGELVGSGNVAPCPRSALSAVLTPGLISRCPDKFKLLEPFIKSGPGAAHTLWLPKPSLIIHKPAGRQAPVRNGPRSGVPTA